MSVSDALAVSATPGANHLAMTVGGDAPQGTRNLIDLVRAEDQKFVAQTLSAIEPPPVVGKEGFDEIAVHVQVIGPNRPPGEKVRLGGLDGGRSPPDECPLCGARPR